LQGYWTKKQNHDARTSIQDKAWETSNVSIDLPCNYEDVNRAEDEISLYKQ